MAFETTEVRGIIVDAGPPTSGPTLRNPATTLATTFYYDTVGLALYQNLPTGLLGVNAWTPVNETGPQSLFAGPFPGPFVVPVATRSVYVANAGVAAGVTLPALAGFPNGDEILVKKIDAGAGVVTVGVTGLDTIDLAATYVFAASFQGSLLVRADSAAGVWRIVSTRQALP